MKKTIAYKVVSENWKSFILDSIKGKRPDEYILSYELNKETKCVKNSIGIMCFEKPSQAFDFFYTNMIGLLDGIILEIEGIDQMPLCRLCTVINELDYFYKTNPKFRTYSSEYFPEGTILFSSIIPLKINQILNFNTAYNYASIIYN